MTIVFAAPATKPAEKEEQPHPYNFGYEEKDANYTITRQEEMDEKGTVKGSYSYIDRDGTFRTVNYIADENGFRAAIQSNEPGLTNSA
ncbi:cuticle protein 57A-like protein, partial [Euroglyphus maynei]